MSGNISYTVGNGCLIADGVAETVAGHGTRSKRRVVYEGGDLLSHVEFLQPKLGLTLFFPKK